MMNKNKFKLASPKFNPIFTLKDSEGNRADHQIYYSGRGTGKSVAIAQGVIFHTNRCNGIGRSLRLDI